MHIRKSLLLLFLTSAFVACTPQAVAVENTPTHHETTITVVSPTIPSTSTPSPSETLSPTDIPSITPASCAMPLNPVENASVPATGPFDFTWTPFEGAASYVVSIGPSDWYPTIFPVTGTTLTRYMEIFPSSPSYEWSIVALNSAGQEICRTDPHIFVTSANVYATPSSAENNSLGGSSNDTTNDLNSGSNSGSGKQELADVSVLITSDSDSECRLSVSYRVKSNYPLDVPRLYYSYDGGSTLEFVELFAHSSDPYPAYNNYSAITPPLPVPNGTTVQFGASFTGSIAGGLPLFHTMSSCNP